jgi:hypothetical protein
VTSSSSLKSEYFRLMARACDILVLLPSLDTITSGDESAMADATMLLAEFAEVDRQMNEIVMVMKCHH